MLEENARFVARRDRAAQPHRRRAGHHSTRPTTRCKTPDGFIEAYKAYVDGRLGRRAVRAEATAAAGSRGSSASPCRSSSPAPTWRSRCARCSPRAPSTCCCHHGSEEQKEVYLPKMVTGEWTGTMNLTEPEAGSDVGALRTKAVPARRRHLPHHRHEDLHHLRRARHGRQHRPPRAGPHARTRPPAPRASRASSSRSSW